MISAIDPGTHTGIASCPNDTHLTDGENPLEMLAASFTTAEFIIPAPEDSPNVLLYDHEHALAIKVVDHLISQSIGEHLTVILEDFTVSIVQKGSNFLSPVRIAARIDEQLRERCSDYELHWQSPSAQAAMKDERLKSSGLWVKGSAHKRSALKHLAVYLRKQ